MRIDPGFELNAVPHGRFRQGSPGDLLLLLQLHELRRLAHDAGHRLLTEELEHSLIEYEFTEPSSIDEDKDGNKRRK